MLEQPQSQSPDIIDALDSIPEQIEKTDSSSNGSAHGGRVKFDKIYVREYERTIGDNPSVSSGPALTIGWKYYPDSYEISIDVYEDTRAMKRRKPQEMTIPRSVRESILKYECGCSSREMAECVREINSAKAQRRRAIHTIQHDAVQERMERMRRKLGRLVGARKSTEKQIEQLWEDAAKRSRMERIGDGENDQ